MAKKRRGRPGLSSADRTRILQIYSQLAQEQSLRSIAGVCGISITTLTRLLDEEGIARPRRNRRSEAPKDRPREPVRPSLKAVAARAGVSASTASLALRDNPRVHAATRERVKAAAAAIGYSVHPYIGAQLAAVRRGRVADIRANFAYLYADHAVSTPWREALNRLYGPRRRFEAAQKTAKRYGYGLEPFLFRDPELRPQRLQQILESRGIRGLILDFPAYLAVDQEFDFSRFNCVSFNQQSEFRPHVFSNNDFQNVMLAFCRLWELGYRKIGFAVGDSRMVSSVFRPEAAYVHCQRHIVPEELRLPILYEEIWMKAYLRQLRHGKTPSDSSRVGENEWLLREDWSDLERRLERDESSAVETTLEAIIAKWMQQNKPDVMICSDRNFRTRLERLGYRVPDDIGLVHLQLDADVPEWTGVRTAEEELAEAAVRELNHSIEVGQFGAVRHPLQVRFTGEWIEGATTRKIKKPKTALGDVAEAWIRLVKNQPMAGPVSV